MDLRGIDLNPASLAKAKAARYTTWALRATTDEMRDRYFRPDGRDYGRDEARVCSYEPGERLTRHPVRQLAIQEGVQRPGFGG